KSEPFARDDAMAGVWPEDVLDQMIALFRVGQPPIVGRDRIGRLDDRQLGATGADGYADADLRDCDRRLGVRVRGDDGEVRVEGTSLVGTCLQWKRVGCQHIIE